MFATLTIDWTGDYDYVDDLLLDTFECAQNYNCRVTIMELEGPGGNWPEVRFEGEYNDLKELAMEYGMDEDEFEEFVKVDNK